MPNDILDYCFKIQQREKEDGQEEIKNKNFRGYSGLK